MIEVKELSKVYREGKGIRKVSFQVEQGTAFGFLGPNGAGKTTTIRLLMGFLKPDSGLAAINQLDCWQEKTAVKKVVAYLPGELCFIENMTGLDFLELMAGMRGNPPPITKRRNYFANAFELDLSLLIRKMSKGMKQKLGIISALMLDASVLIFDEPTSGLDPLMQKVFIDLILEEKNKGKTLFMSSHHFPEIERTCEKVGIIKEGSLLTVQSITRLREVEYQRFEIEVASDADAELLKQSSLELIAIDEKGFIVQVAGELDRLWQVLSSIQVKGFRQRTLELEEAFMDFYR